MHKFYPLQGLYSTSERHRGFLVTKLHVFSISQTVIQYLVQYVHFVVDRKDELTPYLGQT